MKTSWDGYLLQNNCIFEGAEARVKGALTCILLHHLSSVVPYYDLP
jgi:hypothetical protein